MKPSAAGNARPDGASREQAYRVAADVCDPELPMLTLADLGVLRSVRDEAAGWVVTITPTYIGCPALATMRDDVVHRLADAGFTARVEVSLSPAWSSDWITPAGHQKLREHGYSTPSPANSEAVKSNPRGPVPLQLTPRERFLTCPACGSPRVQKLSEFGATACKALYRCSACQEPFEHIKEL